MCHDHTLGQRNKATKTTWGRGGEGERGRGGGVLEKFEKGRVSNIGGLYKIGSLEPSSNYA